MISINWNEINKEYDKQEERLNAFETKARKMHSELIHEVEQLEYDLYQRDEPAPNDNNHLQQDNLKTVSASIVNNDSELRKTLKGPTITKEKFRASYWNHWNRERDLLEAISHEEILQSSASRSGKGASTHFTKSNVSRQTNRNTGTKKGVPNMKGDYRVQHTKSAIFANPTVALEDTLNHTLLNKTSTGESMGDRRLFDSHLLGNNNSIQQLTAQASLKPTAVPSSSSAKLKASQKQTCEKESFHDPEAIGKASVRGGSMSQTNPRPPLTMTLTSNCDIPNNLANNPVVAPKLKGGAFGLERRFPSAYAKEPISSSSTALPPLTSSLPLQQTSPSPDNSGFKFSCAERFPGSSFSEKKEDGTNQGNPLATPGPGQYTVTRLFDVGANKEKTKDFGAIYQKYKHDTPGISAFPTYDLAVLAVMGRYCDLQEHIRYGRCSHPNCCRRTEAERAMLQSHDLPRIVGYDTYQQSDLTYLSSGRLSSDPINEDPSAIKHRTSALPRVVLQNELQLSNAISSSVLPKPIYRLSALYTAAFDNNCQVIQELARLEVNPNEYNPENGYTALHIAVSQNNEAAVLELLHCFRGTIDLNLPERSQGNTALHLACQKLLYNMVMILCQEEDCDPLCLRNYQGEYPLDIVYIQNIKHNNNQISHQIWQVITITNQRNSLKQELQQLKK